MYMTSREFNQRTSHALKLANESPVIITNRGKPVQVVIDYETYQKLTQQPTSALESLLLAEFPAEVGDVELDIERCGVQRSAVDFG